MHTNMHTYAHTHTMYIRHVLWGVCGLLQKGKTHGSDCRLCALLSWPHPGPTITIFYPKVKEVFPSFSKMQPNRKKKTFLGLNILVPFFVIGTFPAIQGNSIQTTPENKMFSVMDNYFKVYRVKKQREKTKWLSPKPRRRGLGCRWVRFSESGLGGGLRHGEDWVVRERHKSLGVYPD
jgi:hypothetical protein